MLFFGYPNQTKLTFLNYPNLILTGTFLTLTGKQCKKMGLGPSWDIVLSFDTLAHSCVCASDFGATV